MDARDWFVMGSIAALQIAASAFIFIHPSTENFVTWAGVVATIGGFYHYLVIKDSKQQDAPR